MWRILVLLSFLKCVARAYCDESSDLCKSMTNRWPKGSLSPSLSVSLGLKACLQCPSCSYVTITNVPGLVKSVVDSTLGLFQDEQCSQELSGPITEIKEETCSEQSGRVSRCSWYKGVLTMTVPVLGTELPFHVSKRGCYSAAAAATPADGCHDLNNLQEDKSAIQEIIDSLTSVLNVHTFEGQRCIYSKTYGTSAAPYIHNIYGISILGSLLFALMLKFA